VSLVTVAALRLKVKTGLSDANLQTIIDNEEAALVAKFGAHGDGVTPVTELAQRVGPSVYLGRRAVSVTTVATYPGATPATLATTSYYTWPSQGRIQLYPSGLLTDTDVSNELITVTYVPADDREVRKQVITELVRLALEQTAMKSESIAGEYSYQAPEWEATRARQYRRLTFFEV
jgi:hypothetical protein